MSTPLRTLGHGGAGGAWYGDGLRFECTGSGKCCTVHGEYAYVYVTRAEQRRIAALLEIPVREMRARHTERPEGGGRSLRFPDGRCTFLDGRRCSIYDARPRQCRTWPFWEENLQRDVWETEIAPFCPGVGRGRLYAAAEIREVLRGRRDVAAPPEAKGEGGCSGFDPS